MCGLSVQENRMTSRSVISSYTYTKVHHDHVHDFLINWSHTEPTLSGVKTVDAK